MTELRIFIYESIFSVKHHVSIFIDAHVYDFLSFWYMYPELIMYVNVYVV